MDTGRNDEKHIPSKLGRLVLQRLLRVGGADSGAACPPKLEVAVTFARKAQPFTVSGLLVIRTFAPVGVWETQAVERKATRRA
jgi:hypothetical protein